LVLVVLAQMVQVAVLAEFLDQTLFLVLLLLLAAVVVVIIQKAYHNEMVKMAAPAAAVVHQGEISTRVAQGHRDKEMMAAIMVVSLALFTTVLVEEVAQGQWVEMQLRQCLELEVQVLLHLSQAHL
jgi:cell division protein YceG involved in septum cleavage